MSGKVYGAEEMVSLVDSALDFWLTTGRFNAAFEKRLQNVLGVLCPDLQFRFICQFISPERIDLADDGKSIGAGG